MGPDLHIWDVHRLVRLSKSLQATSLPLAEIEEADQNWWYGGTAMPTPRSIAAHMMLVQETDFAHPIILCAEGKLMDGMHRVVRAIIESQSHLKAVRFPVTPEPDYINLEVGELPYPDKEV